MKNNLPILYDCIVIGAGPSGAQAAIYLLRANKKVLVIYKTGLGALSKAQKIENYYGIDIITGRELDQIGKQKIKTLGADMLDAEVVGVQEDYKNNEFFVATEFGGHYRAKTIIIAAGNETKPNDKYKILATSGVSYCALCDGFFYKNKKVALVGSGKFMANEYKHLLNVTSDITIFSNGVSLDENDIKNAKIVLESIKTIENNAKMTIKITLSNKKTMEFDGVFIAEGRVGATAFSKLLGVEMTSNGHIKVDENMQTNVVGIFACGDITGGIAQIAKAVSDGTIAGLGVIKYLDGNRG